MISILFFLSSFLPPIDSEFEEWNEFEESEEIYETFVGESLIGSTEWTDYLHEFDPHIEPETFSSDWNILFSRYVKNKDLILDYGAKSGGCTLLFSQLVGTEGKVFAFESEPSLFRALFWNLVHKKCQNARIYCSLEIGELDLLELENVSLIRIDANGREDLVLKGAEKTIHRCRPVLVLNLLGGLSVERSDHYVKQEFHRRMGEIHKMGYTTQRITDSWYLALP